MTQKILRVYTTGHFEVVPLWWEFLLDTVRQLKTYVNKQKFMLNLSSTDVIHAWCRKEQWGLNWCTSKADECSEARSAKPWSWCLYATLGSMWIWVYVKARPDRMSHLSHWTKSRALGWVMPECSWYSYLWFKNRGKILLLGLFQKKIWSTWN